MNAQREHSRTGALVMILGLAVAVPACAREREPTGPSDADAAEAAGPSGAVYPEERRAVELSETVPDLAGFYYDTAGNVIVALKDREESDAIRHALRPRFARELIRARGRNPGADVLVRRAQYSFLELKAWRDRLMAEDVLAHPGVVWLDLDEVKNRVVIGLDGGDPITLLGVPPDVVEFEATGPYVVQQTLQSELRPILGGIQIQRVSGSQRVSCTLGFNALWNDQQVFLTAGHCSPNRTGTDGVEQFQPVAPLTAGDSSTTTAVGREIFHHSEPCGNRRCSYSDAAIYEVLADTIPPIPDQQWRLGYIAKTVSGCFRDCPEPILDLDPNRPYWIIDTTHQSFIVNDLVSKMGSATGWSQALVQRTCVNVSPSQGVTLNCQMFADYGADDGDSGGPILLDIGCCTDSTVTLGGMHSGRAGSNSVFSPWSGIVQDYGSLSVVFVQQDTTRPPVPATPNLPDDSTLTVLSPWGGDVRYHRNIVVIAFDDSTSGLTVRRVLAKYKGAIIGGSEVREEPAYFVRIPDPGTTFAAIDSVTSLIEAEPGVKWAYIPTWRGLIRIRSRYPQDGPQSTRRDWFSPTEGTRARLAIRAPLAWDAKLGRTARGQNSG